jgi:hypothetical protein
VDDKNQIGGQGMKEHLPHEDRHQGEEDHQNMGARNQQRPHGKSLVNTNPGSRGDTKSWSHTTEVTPLPHDGGGILENQNANRKDVYGPGGDQQDRNQRAEERAHNNSQPPQ